MFIISKNKYLSNGMKIFGTCSIPLTIFPGCGNFCYQFGYELLRLYKHDLLVLLDIANYNCSDITYIII